MIEIIKDNDFETKILENNFVLVDFWAEWCMPCKMLMPVLEKLQNEFNNKDFDNLISIKKINIEENPLMKKKFKIMSIPTLILFSNGKILKFFYGVKTYIELKKEILKYLKQ